MSVRTTVTYSPDSVYVEIGLADSAARTATAAGTSVSLPGSISKLRFQLEVTAVTGTNPTLDVLVQDSIDGTNWATIGTFTQKTAAGLQVIDVATLFSRRIRASWTIGGTATPTFTFSVKGIGRKSA